MSLDFIALNKFLQYKKLLHAHFSLPITNFPVPDRKYDIFEMQVAFLLEV